MKKNLNYIGDLWVFFDQEVFDYALEDAFVKVAKVKSVRNFCQDAQSDPQVDLCSAP